MTFRISTERCAGVPTIIRVAGRLAGDAIDVLMGACVDIGPVVTIDLSEVYYADVFKRGAMLQADGTTTTIHSEAGEVLRSVANLLLYDEEVPREGARITRQRRLARWSDGSTWLWTGFRNEVGQGEGASALRFDQLIEPGAPGTD